MRGVEAHPPSPSQHGKRSSREGGKEALTHLKSSPGSPELHFTTNHEVDRIPRSGIGRPRRQVDKTRQEEKWRIELTSLRRTD